MAACPDYEVLLDLHATGALETEEAARVQKHVKACDGCREALASTVRVLGLAELPPLSAEEKAVVEELPRSTLAAWRREARQRAPSLRTLGSLMAAAAAVAAVLLVPGVLPDFGGDAGTGAPAAEASTGPDVDAETMAAFEAWAGLDPLDEDAVLDDALEEGDGLDDEDSDFTLGETL